MKPKTNIELVTDMMEFAPTGAMAQAFVIEAIRRYAEQCVAAPPGHFESQFMTDAIWRSSAQHCLDKINGRG